MRLTGDEGRISFRMELVLSEILVMGILLFLKTDNGVISRRCRGKYQNLYIKHSRGKEI